MKLRIFVIDDEESIRDIFRMHLEDQGHEVLTADSPLACPVFSEHDCDNDLPCGHVLFVDYFFDDLNGLDFLEKLERKGCKGVSRNKILMTGGAALVDQERVKKIGCKVVQKPITLSQIDRIISEIIPSLDPEEKLAELH